MSDSDDTDILLLIPPDFFLVHSSDEGSNSDRENKFERSVVNDLISQVNELEDRIALIEGKELSQLNESASSVRSPNYSNLTLLEMNPSSRFGSLSSLNASPTRRITRFNSLPPSPSSTSYRSLAPSVASGRASSRYLSSPSKSVLNKNNKNFSDGTWENERHDKSEGRALLSEVDNFLDGLKRDSLSTLRNREKELVSSSMPPSPNKKDIGSGTAKLQLDDVDRLLKEVEAEQKNIEARLGSHDSQEVRRIVRKPGEDIGSIPDLGYGVRDQWKDVNCFLENERSTQPVVGYHNTQNESNQQPVDEAVVTTRKQYQLGDNVGSIPDLGYGVREAWNSLLPPKQNKPPLSSEPKGEHLISPKKAVMLEANEEILPKQTPKPFSSRRKLDLESHAVRNVSLDDVETISSPESSQSAAHETAAVRKRRAAAEASKVDTQRGESGMAMPLPSLSELWSDEEGTKLMHLGSTKLLQKIEEERCRRQHCEQLVQALQTKLLESQQKLAVALQVDSDKDAAIAKLKGAWNSLADHWRRVEDQRHALSKQLQDQKFSSESQLGQMEEKLERYEIELSKALDLAHGYKEQSENAERMHSAQMEELANKAQELERRLSAANEACTRAEEREEKLRSQINEDHKKLTKLQTAMDAAMKSLSLHEADKAVLTEEKSALQIRLKEEKAHLETLQQTKDKISVELEESKKRERSLQNELKKNAGMYDALKTELHDFYQAQLERVVRDKLKEFQSQLDAAEATLQKELENRERSVAQLAARQLQHVTEKHKLEVTLLEQKHSEELRLMQLQLTKAARQIRDLENRLAAFEKRSSTLAERLHGVMESQWREALNIISNPNDTSDSHETPAMKLGKQSENANDTAWMLVQQQQQHQKSQSQCSSHSSAEDTPFSRDGQMTHRIASPVQHVPSQSLDGEELKKYIKMLLDRTPGNPVSIDQSKLQANSKAASGVTPTPQLKPPWK